jgi:hypothetical protein
VEELPLPPGVDLTAYRLVQEGLTNARKHSSASRTEVRLRYEVDAIEVEVCDDGRGAAAVDQGGQGLVGMRERVSIHGRRVRAGPRGRWLPVAGPPAGAVVSAIRVLVVDDQALVRAGFRMILEAEPDVEVVAEAADGVEAVAAVQRHQPDVVLMDVRMPNLDGIAPTRRILEGGNATKVLM